MLEYIIVTESALDFCLINNGFTDEFCLEKATIFTG